MERYLHVTIRTLQSGENLLTFPMNQKELDMALNTLSINKDNINNGGFEYVKIKTFSPHLDGVLNGIKEKDIVDLNHFSQFARRMTDYKCDVLDDILLLLDRLPTVKE